MFISLPVSRDSVVVLYKGGRLPAWHDLTAEEQDAYSREHVDLMLSVAREHGMTRLEGFNLFSPIGDWARFWAIEFPTFEGAEAWIAAEMEPPYGRYGYYEYYLSRPLQRESLRSWVVNPPEPMPPPVRPALNPVLEVDTGSVIVVTFARWLSGADAVPTDERGDAEHVELMKYVGREHGLMRIEAYQLVAPQPDWHRAWIAEFPTLAGAEAWIDADLHPPHGRYTIKTYHLARKWAPEYFSGWVPR